jgi:vacuolar-type H+-ATPase subunit F/Vma7
MTHGVRVLCRPATAAGFALAGIVAETADEESVADAALRSLLQRPEVGVVLLENSLYQALAPDLRAVVDRVAQPVVVPFPGPAWRLAPSAEEQVVELLRRAIGYRVRLR